MIAPLVPAQVDAFLVALSAAVLNISPAALVAGAVRIGWPTEGAPTSAVADDVIYVRSVEDDDEYNRVRDVEERQLDDNTLTTTTTYTRVWRAFWVIYGPNSFDRARQLRSSLFKQVFHDVLAVQGIQLAFIPDEPSPRRIPEPFPGGQWIERVDFSCQFNELTAEVDTLGVITSVQIIVDAE